ncbi:hypothetical protein P154DRAFT_568204 [Amniculicola lignicola CBS 123094]|uniref:Uncharacterized protein n=1 Tax=Amniculicola lignicola CBS 123094 TaxID=1392246 RepID=A0A6A5VWQ0_9PLEO|nr:hypothetical protein P154DRAFT_568204 [Amniculicola lignicola CBS 123094]
MSTGVVFILGEEEEEEEEETKNHPVLSMIWVNDSHPKVAMKVESIRPEHYEHVVGNFYEIVVSCSLDIAKETFKGSVLGAFSQEVYDYHKPALEDYKGFIDRAPKTGKPLVAYFYWEVVRAFSRRPEGVKVEEWK